MTRCNSDSRIIVRPPTFVRRNFPLLNQVWTVHRLMPPKRRAASSTESSWSTVDAPNRKYPVRAYYRLTKQIFCRTIVSMARQWSRDRNKQGPLRPAQGEDALRYLINWLNSDPDTEEKARTRELLGLSKQLFELVHSGTKPAHGLLDANVERLENEINLHLKRYKAVRAVFVNGDDIRASWDAKPVRLSALARLTMEDYENLLRHREFTMIHIVMDALESGLLPKIARCQCGTFFFARSSHSRFCSASCRVTYWENSEIRKAQKRKRARQYYSLHRNKNTK